MRTTPGNNKQQQMMNERVVIQNDEQENNINNVKRKEKDKSKKRKHSALRKLQDHMLSGEKTLHHLYRKRFVLKISFLAMLLLINLQ